MDLPSLGDPVQQFLVNVIGALLEERSAHFVKIVGVLVCVLFFCF